MGDSTAGFPRVAELLVERERLTWGGWCDEILAGPPPTSPAPSSRRPASRAKPRYVSPGARALGEGPQNKALQPWAHTAGILTVQGPGFCDVVSRPCGDLSRPVPASLEAAGTSILGVWPPHAATASSFMRPLLASPSTPLRGHLSVGPGPPAQPDLILTQLCLQRPHFPR